MLDKDQIQAIIPQVFAPWVQDLKPEVVTIGDNGVGFSIPENDRLVRAREADDLRALKALGQVDEVFTRCTDGPSVRLLWDVCRVPDFRGISHAEHASLLESIFIDLHQRGTIPDDWLARQIKRIDRTDGDRLFVTR